MGSWDKEAYHVSVIPDSDGFMVALSIMLVVKAPGLQLTQTVQE